MLDKILKDSLSIWLDANLKTLNKRVKWNAKRPLVNTEDSQTKINKKIAKSINLFKCDKLVIADFLLNKFFWHWKIYFIKQKYS